MSQLWWWLSSLNSMSKVHDGYLRKGNIRITPAISLNLLCLSFLRIRRRRRRNWRQKGHHRRPNWDKLDRLEKDNLPDNPVEFGLWRVCPQTVEDGTETRARNRDGSYVSRLLCRTANLREILRSSLTGQFNVA